MLVNCGCKGEISGHHLDGEPYIERTIDIGFCPLHKATPKLLAALKRIKDIIDRSGTQALQEFFEEIVSELPTIRTTIAEAKGDADVADLLAEAGAARRAEGERLLKTLKHCEAAAGRHRE